MYSLLDYLEQSAAAYPDKPAFIDPGKTVSFSQLMHSARAIGSALSHLVAPCRGVAVCMDKGADAITAFLGVLYAGCFYCYLDPKSPSSRTASMLSSLQPGAIILGSSSVSFSYDCPLVHFEDLTQHNEEDSVLHALRQRHIDLDPAYCSFTSGSTGTPKGVLVSHRSVIDFIDVFCDLFDITAADVTACQSPLDFDISVKDIFSGLKTGATVALVPKFYFVFLPTLLEYLQKNRVTTLIWAVSALCLLAQRDALSYKKPEFLNKFIFSGEVMPPKQLLYWKRHYPNARFVNVYGPTEITCNCTYYILPNDYNGGEIPIGQPFPNERVFLLDEQDCPVTQPGQIGEICVAGTAVALGYCGLPENTAFSVNPLCSQWSQRIYRTGDLGRYQADGLLYYAGRRDFQIKRHGRRVELTEIESALHAIDGIDRACVIYHKETQTLIACLTGRSYDRKDLNLLLQDRLPDYMIPDRYLYYDSLPLNSHGKIDRSALLQACLNLSEEPS